MVCSVFVTLEGEGAWGPGPGGQEGQRGKGLGLGLPSLCIEMGFNGEISFLWITKGLSIENEVLGQFYLSDFKKIFRFYVTPQIPAGCFSLVSSCLFLALLQVSWASLGFSQGISAINKVFPSFFYFLGKTTARPILKKSLSFWNNLGTD